MSKVYTRLFGKEAEDSVLCSKLENLISLFNFTPDDLLIQWETYKSNVIHNTNEKLSEPLLDSLHIYIQDKITRQNEKVQSTPNFGKIKGIKSINGSSLKKQQPINSNGGGSSNIPLLKKRKLNFSSPANTSIELPSDGDTSLMIPSTTGEILETLSPTNLPNKETTELSKDIKIMANFNAKKYKYRTQNMKTLEIADYLDDQIDNFYEIIKKAYNCENQFGDPNRMSQSQIVAIGRIVPDSPLSNSKTELNLDSLILETGRNGQYGGYGKRVKLDFTELERDSLGDFSLFPGQLIAFKGINNDGLSFKVKTILKIPYLGSTTYSKDEIDDFNSTFNTSNDDNLKIAIANGPFHCKSNLDFNHLSTFIDHLNTNIKPDVVILLGPFLDINLLKNMNLQNDEQFKDLKTPEQIFKSIITPILLQLNCSKIILIAHNNDSTMPHNVYPQPGFNRKELGLSNKFKCFPNPSIFHLNEIGIGISNIDIFRGIKDIPLNLNNNNNNSSNLTRIDRIVSHILQQRHFHPQMISMSNDKINIDGSYLGLAEIDDELPDILILPSVIKRFAKIIKNVIVINPGQLVKGDKNGSFAVLQVSKPKISLKSNNKIQLNSNGEPINNQLNNENDDDNWCLHKILKENDEDNEEVYEEYLSNVWKRCRVDLYSV